MKYLLVVTLALLVRPSWAVNPESAQHGHDGRIAVAVEDYEVGRWEFHAGGDWHGREWHRRNRHSCDEDTLGHDVASAVRDALRKNERFALYDEPRSRDDRAGEVSYEDGDADYLVRGEIERVVFTVERNETKSTKRDHDGKKHEEICESFEGSAEITVRHTALDSRTGRVWKEVESTKSVSQSFSDEPYDDDLFDLAVKASKGTVNPFVRALVPEVEGRVIGKNGQFVVIDFGRLQGVGQDVDFTFARIVPVLGTDGRPVLDRDGGVVTQKLIIAVQPGRKHDKPFSCIGRPEQIDDTTTLVRVGYNGSGGFFGPEYEWKRSDNSFAAIREGDIVILTARPGDAK